MTVCLLCLKSKAKQIIKLCSKKGKDLNCSFIIAKYFWFQLNELNDSKKSVCFICWKILKEFHEFYQTILEAHNLLGKVDLKLNKNVEGTLNDALSLTLKPTEGDQRDVLSIEDGNSRNFNTDLFNAEIKIETNDLELLPTIEIIENQHVETAIEISRTEPPNNCDSISSHDDDSETDIPLSILQQTQTKKLLRSSTKIKNELIDLSNEENNKKEISTQLEDQLEAHNDNLNCDNFTVSESENVFEASDNEEYDFNPDSDDSEQSEEEFSKSKSKKTHAKKSHEKSLEKEKHNEIISQFFKNIQCTKCNLTLLNYDVLIQHFRIAHKGFVPSSECCGRKFYLRRTLSEHAYLHLHPEYFKCCHLSCDKVFENKSEVQDHEKTHKKMTVKSEIFQCDKCPKTFTSKRNLDEHQAVHISKEDYQFPCSVCGLKFASMRRVRHHIKYIHSFGQSLICETCGMHTKNYKALKEHKTQHVKAPNKITISKQCNICGEWLKNGETMKDHKSLVHKFYKIFKDENGLYHCNECPKTFASKQSFNEHRAVHISKEDYKFPCSVCGLKFATKRRAHHHMRDIHSRDRSLICETCGKQARNRKALRMHKARHLETSEQTPDPVQCDICGKWLKQRDTLRQHKTWVHKNNVEQRCHICDKVSPNLRALERHITRTHAMELKFKCSWCTKSYRTERELKDHTNVHTREILYKCEICPKSFSRKSSLEKHKRNFHTNNPVKVERAQCEICNVWVNSCYYLKEHMMKMHEQKNFEYRCPICGRVSVNEIALKRHIKRNHKQDDDETNFNPEISSEEIEITKIEIQNENIMNSTAANMV